MSWFILLCIFIAVIWLAIRSKDIDQRKNDDDQVRDIGILEAQKRWPRCTISSMSGNLYIAFRDNEIVGTTYYESQLALAHKAYATTGAGIGRVSMFLPQTIGICADVRNIIGTTYVIMNIINFPKDRTGGAEAEYVFCDKSSVLFFITSKDIQNRVYIPRASIGCADLKIAIFLGPQMHLFSEMPLRVRYVGRAGCNRVWNDSFDARAVSRPITLAFSYQADMTKDEIRKESEDWSEQMRCHTELEKLLGR